MRLLPFAGANAAGATVIAEPPMVIDPGLAPVRNVRLEGIGVAGTTTCVPHARENPKVAAFTRLVETV